jgi:phosphoglycerate dehydrogenase-like enzyme
VKAFIFDPLWDELITDELLRELKSSGLELSVTKTGAPLSSCTELFEGNEERLLCLNPDYVSWKLTSADYSSIPNLKAILLASTGYEWVEQDYANEHNIPICQIVNFSTEAVAEWAIMMTFNLARQTPRLIKDGFPLDYDKDFMKYRGIELHGKTAGIIGMGHIGQAIARRCAGLGMNVIYWSRKTRIADYEYRGLSELMAEADVVYPIMAQNDETKALFTTELINSMKPTAILIDDAHGLIDQTLLVEKVKNGTLFGYGFEGEPTRFNSFEGNVWAAPAYGWATDSSMYNSMAKWAENMISASQGNFPNRVNQK